MANNGLISDLLKNLAVAGTGLGSGALGSIPSLVSLGSSGLQSLEKKLDPKGKFKKQGGFKAIKSLAEKATPEKLQEYAGKLSGGYLTPKTKTQKVVSEVSQDIGSVIGLGGPAKSAVKFATLGNVAKQGVKLAGGSDEKAEVAKVIGMLTSPLFKFNKISDVYKSLYKDVRSSITPNSVTTSSSIHNSAKEVIKSASKGGSVPYKNSVRRFATSIANKIDKNTIPVEELWEFKKDLNEITTRGVFADRKRALLKPLEKSIRSSLSSYGSKNKEFGFALKNADTLFGIDKGLPLLDKAINKSIGLKNSGLSEYFRKALAYGAGGLKGLYAKKVLGSLTKRGEAFLKSPAYRKASIDLAKASSKNSLPLTVNALRKLKNINGEMTNGLKTKNGMSFKLISDKELPKKVAPKKKKESFTMISDEEVNKIMNKK